jgi:hypothetical protein
MVGIAVHAAGRKCLLSTGRCIVFTIRGFMALTLEVAMVAWCVPASALTLEQATAQCRRQFAHLSDTEGAPRMQQQIEACAAQKMQQQGSGSSKRR